MSDVIEFTSSGALDPDEALKRQGLTDTQTGRTKKSVAISTRARAATALRVHGATYAEIADQLEYPTESEARKAVEGVLASTADETKDYRALRALANLRLEGLFKAVAGRALNENDPDQLGFHRAASQIMDRWIKLNGLDAPQRIEFTNPSTEEFENVITLMVASAGEEKVSEADIFELPAVAPQEWKPEDDEA